MQRIKIEKTEDFTFCVDIPLRITDLNYGNHVGNDSILTLAHEARIKYLQHLGLTEKDDHGDGLIMSDAGIEFKKEIFYGDNLVIWVKAASPARVGFDLIYKFETTRNNQKDVAAIVKTGMICYNYKLAKVISLPDNWKEKLFI
jgi:acyl-CoA thioester hydrolase